MIYIVRHGQTDWNAAHKLQGATDIPLNEAGIKEAHDVAEELKDVKFDVVYCSPLQRAKKTCEIIWDGKIVFDDRLRERSFGEFEGHNPYNHESHFSDIYNWVKDLDIGGGERVSEFEKRVFEFFDEILEKHPNKTILVVCHGGVIRMAKGYFMGKPNDGDYYGAYGVERNVSILKFEGGRVE